MKFDRYFLVARGFPAIISAIPIFILYIFLLRPSIGAFLGELFSLQVASDITLSLALFFVLVEINRYVAKELFEKKVFNNYLDFPTTAFLLHHNGRFSEEYKKKVHGKIMSDYGITVPPAAEEASDPTRSRKIIDDAVGQVRAKVGTGRLTGQHNIEYGFRRNLAGGAVIAIVISVINIVIFGLVKHDRIPLWISVGVGCFYLLYCAMAKKLIVSAAEDYARVLIQEYL